MNMALLIIDVQEVYIGHHRSELAFQMTFEYINAVAALFRKRGLPVITVRDIGQGNEEKYRNADELISADTDIDIVKHYNNSFWKTDLEDILREKDVDFVVVCGNAAEYCVLATFNGAIERDFQAAMLQNGIFAATETGLKDIAFNRPVVSYEVLRYILNK